MDGVEVEVHWFECLQAFRGYILLEDGEGMLLTIWDRDGKNTCLSYTNYDIFEAD
jgi:hypothetical protein